MAAAPEINVSRPAAWAVGTVVCRTEPTVDDTSPLSVIVAGMAPKPFVNVNATAVVMANRLTFTIVTSSYTCLSKIIASLPSLDTGPP